MTRANEKHPGRLLPKAWRVGACIALAALVSVWLWRWASAEQPSWLASAMRSRLFVTHTIIAAAGAVLLAIICGMFIRAGRAVRRVRSAGANGGQDGVAMLEFALVLPVALMLVLMMAQSALLMVGNLCVHYAAFCAARSAIVYVPMGVWSRSGEDRNIIYAGSPSSYKLRSIKDAAVWAVLPVSASSRLLPEGYGVELVDGIDSLLYQYNEDTPHWVRALLGRKLYYANKYTEVWLDPPENGRDYAAAETLNVHVRHVLYMPIPYANRIYAAIDSGDGVELDFGPDEYGMTIHASCVLTNEGVRDYIEDETYPQ